MKRKPLIRFIPFRLALLVAPLLAAWPQYSRAAVIYWDNTGGGTANVWGDVANWSTVVGGGTNPAAIPGAGDIATFSATPIVGTAQTVNLNADRTVQGLQFTSAVTTATTLQGGGTNRLLTIGASGITKAGTGAVTIGSGTAGQNVSPRLTADQTWANNNNTGVLTVNNGAQSSTAVDRILTLGGSSTAANIVNGVIANNGTGIMSINKIGTGTWILAGANTYTGAVTVNDGILQVRSNAGSGYLVVNTDLAASNNNNLQVSGGVTITQPITLENTGNNARVTLESVSAANANPNTWAGNITFKGGTNQALNANSAPLIINGNIGMDASPSTSIFIRGGNTGTINGTITLDPGCTLFKTDGGTWQISSTGNVMGPVGVADGLLILNNNDALEPDSTLSMGQGSATTGRLQINAGFTQQLTAISTPTGSTSVAGHSIFGPGTIDFGAIQRTITVNDNTATTTELTIHAPIAGSGGFVKTGSGNLFVNGAIAGPVTVNAGVTSGLGGNATIAGLLTVDPGAIIGAGGVLNTGTLTAGGISMGAASAIAANMGSGGNDFIANTGALTASTVSIDVVPNGSLTAGQDIPVIGYTGASPGAANFAISGLTPLGSRATASVVDLGTSIGIHIDSADKIIWTGANNNAWDIATTSNWKLQSDSSPSAFQQYDAMVFDDTGINTAIAITGAATPVRAEFTNTTNFPYSITGPGSMGGTMVLDKTGSGTVTLAGITNTYTGATTVTDGVLIANFNQGTAVVPIPVASPVNVTGNGVVRFISDNLATNVGHAISGNGTVEHNARHVAGATTALVSNFNGNSPNFSGTLRLLSPNGGTQRLTSVPAAAVGTAVIEVQDGHQFYTATGQTYNNAITIAGTGYADANGNIGALRLENTSVWAGPVTIASGGARIGSHNGSGLITGNISGGPLEVNASNYNNNYTVRVTGANSYTTTVIGGQNIQTGGVPSYRLNIGDGGTTGTLGSGAVTIHGDGANGVLGFDRSDGYTLGAGNDITGATGAGTIANSIRRTFVDLDCLGAGFNDGGRTITLGTATLGGSIRVASTRANAVANLASTVTAETVRVSTGQNGGLLNILPGAVIAANQLYVGEAANMSGTITQTGGTANIVGQMRAGHFGTETSTYNMNGGDLTLTGDSPLNSPSTAGAGAANATGDNNINALPANSILGGGIYIGIDGTGIVNHTAGTVTTNWIVLDNRGNTAAGANMPDGIDRYNISGSALLKLRSEWGIIARNTTTDVSLGGGTIQLDNTGTGGPAGNTGADLDVPLDAILNTVDATTTTLDTNGADNSFILTRDVTGTGALDLTGGGSVELRSTGTQTISPILAGNVSLSKTGTGSTVLTGGSGSFTGATTVSAGSLSVDGALGGAVGVLSGATLAGSGTAGAVTVQSGGIIAPGTGAGAAVLGASSADLQAGSRYDVDITAALTADKLNVTGALTANGTIKVTLTGYVPVAGDTFDIADAASFSGSPTFDFTGAALTVGLAWDTSSFLTNGTISVATDDPFTAWAQANSVTGGKSGDDDNDGATNLLEFATNGNPKTNGSGARAYGKLHLLAGENVLTLTVAVRKNATFGASGSKQTATQDKVIYNVEASDDLVNWNTVVVSELSPADAAAVQASLPLPVLDADWEWNSFRTDDSTALDPRDMIRLSVTAAP
jgi:autotransporter-associated beta strand protein